MLTKKGGKGKTKDKVHYSNEQAGLVGGVKISERKNINKCNN